MIQVEGIFAGGAPTLQAKSVTYTKNGTVKITPDKGYDGLSSVDVTVNVASGGGGAEPATLTITSTDYTGGQHGVFIFVDSEGHLYNKFYMGSAFTFPITIETVIGGTVIFNPDGFAGYPGLSDPIGCEVYKYKNTLVTLVTNPQASAKIANMD